SSTLSAAARRSVSDRTERKRAGQAIRGSGEERATAAAFSTRGRRRTADVVGGVMPNPGFAKSTREKTVFDYRGSLYRKSKRARMQLAHILHTRGATVAIATKGNGFREIELISPQSPRHWPQPRLAGPCRRLLRSHR